MFWIVGATLLALFAGAQTWGEIERQRDVATFTDATQSARVQSANREQQATPQVVEASYWQAPGDTVLAILRIPGIALEVPVNYGTDERVLLRGAGLVEGSALPGSNGNVAIAAHRDTHFRGLKDLAVGDRIELAMRDSTQIYIITDLSVVEPTDVHVLADTGDPVLTLVTCYPFYFVGHAPQRFIVRATAVGSSA
ncbi:MAG: class D sortase [Xanthomonadales bacterium]|nr:class D sortase [Xanthomonadales bacterium]